MLRCRAYFGKHQIFDKRIKCYYEIYGTNRVMNTEFSLELTDSYLAKCYTILGNI